MRIPGPRCAQALALTLLGALGWLGGCSDNPGSPCTECQRPQGLIVSNPVPVASLSAAVAGGRGGALALMNSAGDGVVYVSLASGTAPTGSRARIKLVGDTVAITTAVLDGGFDPVAVEAQVGDSIDVRVTDVGGGVVLQARVAVAAVRSPVVIRTYPPPRKRDVPLNAAIVVVFSEPVDTATLTPASVKLMHGTTPVAGTVRLLQGTGVAATFIPAAPLDANTAYQLVVTRAVRDLDGEALAAEVTVSFTTGQSSTGPAASILVSPDTVTLTQGATYQLTATVLDAAGNELIDQPLTWSTSDTILLISQTGLLSAQGQGFYNVFVTLNGVTGFAQVIVVPGVPASVTIEPSPTTVGASGDTIILTATVRDPGGRLIPYPTLSWSSSAPGVATVAPYSAGPGVASVTGLSLGSATITGTSGSARGTASVTVVTPAPVASVKVTPDMATTLLNLTVRLSATVRDASGRVLPGRAISWTTVDAAVATVSSAGLVTGVGAGSSAIIATSEGIADTATITVVSLTAVSVAVGAFHSCVIKSGGAAYCWGYNGDGQLGRGTTNSSTIPVAVVGGFDFSSLSASSFHTCGVLAGGVGMCWGENLVGGLGDGTTIDHPSPVYVSGGLTFSAVTTGAAHSCGLTTNGDAYCWGQNADGELGVGTTTGPQLCHGTAPCDTLPPVRVTGGLTFSQLSAGTGGTYTCGLTTSGAAYCWGDNFAGQLGDSTTASSSVPVRVTGGLTFSAIAAGRFHACGLTAGGAAYCWGDNGRGALGDGTLTSRSSPVPVSGGLTFVALAAGHYHTCGITTGGDAYCWGWNDQGGLGDGTFISQLAPVRVIGGHSFTALSAGWNHTCGIATTGTTYCWGYNGFGQLGDGTGISSSVPLKVTGSP